MTRVWSPGKDRRRSFRGPGAVRRERKGGGGGGRAAAWAFRIVQGAFALTLLAGGAWGAVRAFRYVSDSPATRVEEIRVTGVRALAGEEIAVLTGVRKGEPILEIDLAAIDARVERHPRVAACVVRRIMPSAIEIEIQEREPVALANRRGEIVGLDADGVLLPLYPEREAARLPIVTGVAFERTEPGTRSTDEGIAEALRCLRALTPSLRAQVSEVRLGDDGGVGLILSGSLTLVRMGRGGFEEKVRRLGAALDHFAATGEKKEFIDVRFQDVVTRP